jgi:tetratricopeptide (TPR) repeat protein
MTSRGPLGVIGLTLDKRVSDHESALSSLLQQGDFDNIEFLCNAMVEQGLESCLAYQLLGLIHHRRRDFERALFFKNKAVLLSGGNPEALVNLANTLLSLGRHKEAIKATHQALIAQPDYWRAHLVSAQVLFDEQDFIGTRRAAQKLLAIKADCLDGYIILGNAEKALDNLEAARSTYENGLKNHPQSPVLYANLSAVLYRQGCYQDAVDRSQRALTFDPKNIVARINSAISRVELGDFTNAERELRAAIAQHPHNALLQLNLGNVLSENEEYIAAQESYDRALALDPQLDQARLYRGFLRLRAMRFQEGFADFEVRLKTIPIKGVRSRPINPLIETVNTYREKSIHLVAEQGLGDTIQFSRFAFLLVRRGLTVYLTVQPPLVGIIQASSAFSGVCLNCPVPGTVPYLPLLSAPLFCGADDQVFFNVRSYFRPLEERATYWKSRLPTDNILLGVNWAGSPARVDRGRSFPLHFLKGISLLPRVSLVSVQKGVGAGQLRDPTLDFDVIRFENLDEESGPFQDTLGILHNCSLLITSDTSVAHLGGALGLETWLILKKNHDWRWFGAETSPWYPSMRLFRQKVYGDWQEVFMRVENALRERLAIC